MPGQRDNDSGRGGRRRRRPGAFVRTPGLALGRARSASQGGFTLLEGMVSIAIVSTLVVALASGLLMLIRVTDRTGERQRVQSELANFAERLKAVPYTECATEADYEAAAGYSPEGGIVVSIDDIEYWDRSPAGGGPGAWSPTRCTDVIDDEGAQRLSVSAVRGGDEVHVQMVKGAR